MEELNKKLPHSLMLDDRKKLVLTGVTDVGNFDEENITVYTAVGELQITGEKLQVSVLNVETGQFCAEGKINSVKYSDKSVKNAGFFAKVFR